MTAVGSLLFFRGRSLRYLQFFQQEEYNGTRFRHWFFQRKAFDRRGTISVAVTALAVSLCQSSYPYVSALLSGATALFLYWITRSEGDPCTTGKVTLKMTERARRIFDLSLCLYAGVLALAGASTLACAGDMAPSVFWLLQIALIQTQAAWLVIANDLLMPSELKLQESFAKEARVILKRVNPLVIGITGSYGKTSTKAILGAVLDSVSPTFYPPKSINTYMGITREIRERIKPQHKFAVIEMGAYNRGSIKKLCSLTPPQAAIITAVGEMHLERFGTQQAVFEAKSELAQAVPADGVLVCNADNEYSRKMAADFARKTTILYGLNPDKGPLDAFMSDIVATDKGTNFSIHWKGKEYNGFTRLVGKPMLSNILASFSMACALGCCPEYVIAAIRNVKPESNRLEPVRAEIASLAGGANGAAPVRQGQILRLNDAYNSNPIGFAAALEVLAGMKNGRRVLVTPGMIELGERQHKENQMAARQAAAVCDLVVVVGDTNKTALVEGLEEGGLPAERRKQFATMKEAFSFLAHDYLLDGDVLLIENDLPDLFESDPRF